MCYLYVQQVLRPKDYIPSWIKTGSVICCTHLCCQVCPKWRVHIRTCHWEASSSFFSMYFWWNLCPLYLLAYQVSVTTGELGLSCCVLVMLSECSLASCVGWFNKTICTTPEGSGVGTVWQYICVWVGEQWVGVKACVIAWSFRALDMKTT